MRVQIYGSCVSRDSFELAPRTGLELAGYFARSSMISAFAPARSDLGSSAARVASSFQRRMLEADAGKSLAALLKRQDFDWLLLDLVDERFHVWARGSERLTDSPALRESGFIESQPGSWRRILSGTDEHFAEWCRATDTLLEIFESSNSTTRLAFLDADWAVTIAGTDQHGALQHAGESPAEANHRFARYREYLRSRVSPDVLIQPPSDVTVSDPEQKWGLAPFHYVPGFYEYVSGRLADIAGVSAD